MQFFKRAALAGLAVAALASAGPAFAQYFPEDPPRFPGGPGYDPDYPPPGGRYRYRERYERPYYQPRARVGYTCATRRGSCDLDDGRPIGTVCRCYISGFGPKRGYVQP
jgi:hypothetical protein